MSNVITIYEPQFNPDTIIRSGQVFRMHKNGEIYTAFSGDYGISFTKGDEENEWKFCVSQQDWQEFWSVYFDLSTDYVAYNSIIEQSNDDFLKNSLKNTPGLRILNQDLWEVIVTFIISQNNYIPKIGKTVELLCKNYGEIDEFEVFDGESTVKSAFYTFPKPEKIANLSLDTFKDGSMLGYRADYILELSKAVSNQEFSLEKLSELDYHHAVDRLRSVKGIGPKVANCIALYGLHLMESYPIDTWVKRIITENYDQYNEIEYMKYIHTSYREFQGYVQQLQFCYRRQLDGK